MAVIITGNNTPTAGGVVYGDGTTYATTTAGTSGRPIVSGGAGAPTFRPYTLPAADGSANQVLQTNGSGALSFTTPSTGAMVLVASATASSSSEIVFNNLSTTYRAYMLEYDSVYVSSNGEGLTCRVSTDNGSNYLNSGYTRALVKYSSAGGSISVNANSGDSVFYIGSLDGFSNSSANTGSGILYFFAPNGGNSPFCITEHTVTRNTSGVNEFVTGSMFNTSTTAINAFKLFTGVGTITAGNFRLYGLVNA